MTRSVARTRVWQVMLVALVAGVGPGVSTGAAQDLPNLRVEWKWVDFGPESNLPAGFVREMAEVDPVVWIRTDEGLAWFDGFIWRRPALPPVSTTPSVTSLVAEGEGRALVVRGGQLFSVDTLSSRLAALPGLPTGLPVVRAVPMGDVGTLLTTTDSVAARLWLLADGRVEPVGDVPRPARPEALWRTRSGAVWLDTREGLFSWTSGTWQLREPDPGDGSYVALVAEGDAGPTLIYREASFEARGVYFLGKTPAPEVPRGQNGNALWGADVAPDGTVLCAYETGDVRGLTADGWEDVEMPSARRGGVRFIHISSNGDLWLATGRGLHLFRRRSRWGGMRRDFPALANRINAIVVAPDSAMWLGTGEGITRHKRGPTNAWTTTAGGLPLAPVTGLAVDSAGRAWASSGGAYQGVSMLDGDVWRRMGPEQGMDVGFVHRVFIDAEGDLWMASLGRGDGVGAGVYRRGQDGVVTYMSREWGMPEERAYALAWAPDGTLWVASGLGLYRVADGVATRFELGEGQAGHSHLWDVALDADGQPWVAFNPMEAGGLGYVDPDGTIHGIMPPGPAPVRRVWSVLFDAQGALWTGTEGGVLRFKDGVWALFDDATGLPTVNVWPLAINTDGTLLIGTKGGGMVTMTQSEATNPAPRVILSPPAVEEHSARVGFVALSWWGEVPASRIEARYRLDGGAWSPWGTERSVLLGGIRSGRHAVEVQAKGLYGQLSEPVAAEITIPLPLLLRPMVGGPMVLLLATVLSLLVLSGIRRRRHEATLRESAHRLRTLVESSPEAIGILDADQGRFIDANERALELFDVSREAMSQIGLSDLAPAMAPDGRDAMEAFGDLVRRALHGEAPTSEWVVVSGTGEEVPVELRLTRLPATDQRLLRVSVLDLRTAKAAEARRAELEEQLRQSQKLEAVGQLTGGVAHDFNNLLTVIQGNLEMLLGTSLSEEQVEYIEAALSASGRSTRLTQRLLAFSRRQTLMPQIVDIGELLDGLKELLRGSLSERVVLRIEVKEKLWPVHVDRSQLESTVVNLAINGRDAMPGGGNLIIGAENVPASKVEGPPDLPAAEGYVRLWVRDSGVGMSAEVAGRAFDPFFTTKEVGKGTGLGLSMVHGFVHQSGGTVSLETEEGEGTTVSLILPRADASPR